MLRYTLGLHTPPPSGSFDITPETQYPNCIPRPGIDTPLSRPSQGENPLSRHSVDENAPTSFAPEPPSLASITRLSHSLFLLRKKGCETEVTRRSKITDCQFASLALHLPARLRRVGNFSFHILQGRRREKGSAVATVGSNRSASEVRWLTEHTLSRLQGTGTRPKSFAIIICKNE